MDFSLSAIGMAFVAGLVSVASPCVLPVIPILVTGRERDNGSRPFFLVFGLALTFIIMGIIASIAGSVLTGNMRVIEKAAGIILVIFSLLMLFDVNLFKNIRVFNRVNVRDSGGRFSGFLVGMTLGLVWIPCVGPMLSGILTMVASKASLPYGAFLLGIYSLGFALPMLLVAYFSQFFRQKIRILSKYPLLTRAVGAVLLGGLGVLLLTKGMVGMVIF